MAVFTIVRDEPVWLRIWLRYYLQFFDPADVYILDHGSTLGRDVISDAADRGVHVLPLHNEASFDLDWLVASVSMFQRHLLLNYQTVVFTEADEILMPTPFSDYSDIRDYIERMTTEYACCTGYEVVQQLDVEPRIDFESLPLLRQRRWWYASLVYSKPLIARQPLSWCRGFHEALETGPPLKSHDPALLLVHLHKLDFEYKKTRVLERLSRPFSKDSGHLRGSAPQRLAGEAELRDWWQLNIDGYPNYRRAQPLELIPDKVRDSV